MQVHPSTPGEATAPPRIRMRAATVAAVTLLFLVLTAVMTWPLVAQLPTAIGDHGDPLLNSWILSWNAKRLQNPSAGPWFDTNIFHPHQRTLAWSEHLLPQSLLVAPIIWAGGGGVLAHNLLLFLAFATNGLAMFLLARHHTGEDGPAIAAGIVFAFSPFMFGHLWHLQVLCAAGLPLSLLLLERLIRDERWRDALLLAFVFTAQILANGYYAVFASLLIPIFVAIELTRQGRWTSGRLWIRLLGAGVLVVGLSAPLFAQYIGMQGETGFARNPAAVTNWKALLAVHPLNRLWGPITSHLGAGERHLFPGLLALLLAAWGLFKHGEGKPPTDKRGAPSVVSHAVVGLVALVLSFGSAPYGMVARVWPGFDAIRAVSRLHIFVVLSLALLAAYGLRAIGHGLTARRSGFWRRRVLYGAVSLTLLVEYATIPIPWASTYGPGELPEVYRWVRGQTGPQEVLLELPIPMDSPARPYAECDRIYASTFHWRPLVNGYSGLEPPLYVEMFRRWNQLDAAQNLRDAAALGVGWIIVHTNLPEGPELAARFDVLPELVTLAGAFNEARIYKLLASRSGVSDQLEPLPRKQLRVSANVNPARAAFGIDGDPSTRWDSGLQEPGQSYEIQRGDTPVACGIRLQHGPSHGDWPRGLRVESSTDGTTWNVVAQRSDWRPPLGTPIDQETASADIEFAPTTAPWLRLVLTAQHDHNYWSIHELEILGGAACDARRSTLSERTR